MFETNIKDTYFTFGAESSGLYKEKGSRFIAFGYRVMTEAEALMLVKQIKDKYHDARHHCWAYRIGINGETYRSNDDGEPSGTAGKPILGTLLSHNLTNALIIVVRYFGGIKLGTSGLIDAYKTAADDAISSAKIVEEIVTSDISFTFSYEQIGQIMKFLKLNKIQVVNTDMKTEPCTAIIRIRHKDLEHITMQLKKIESIIFI